jgi:DNA-binding IclR family transcriptional regulator
MASALSVPASTVYRTVQDMVSANFLEPGSDAQYRLGASFIELDRLIRITDPLYRVGTPWLRDMAIQARVPCVAMLARLYNDTVMCVSQASTANGEVPTSYERGLPRPLTRGATSKVILAQLPSRRLRRLLTSAPSGGTLDEMRQELSRIRKQGYCITRGEVDPGLVGIAAPVILADRSSLGSISLAVRAQDVDAQQEERLALLVESTAKMLMQELVAEGV